MKKIYAVTRSFQGGATFDSFDNQKFEKGVVAPIRRLLDTACPELSGIIVVSCGEPDSRFAEEVRGGICPTLFALSRHFPKEVESGLVIGKLCTNWGLNAGSGNALNLGFEASLSLGATDVLFWSPEIDLSGHRLSSMLEHRERYDLALVGYARNRWYQRIQWMFAQNTCALWSCDVLKSINGMNPLCNGDGKTTVETLEHGSVALAGMEDIEAYFRASQKNGVFLRWGIVGRHDPALWNLALKKPGSPEYDDNQKKIARQALVMDEYAKRIFPHREPIDVYDEMMKVFHLG